MKIYPKVFLIAIILVLVPVLAIALISLHLLTRVLRDNATLALHAKLAEALCVCQEAETVLQQNSLAEIPANVENAQAAVARTLVQQRFGGSGHIWAIDTRGIIRAHPDVQFIGSDIHEYRWFAELADRGNEPLTFVWQGQRRSAVAAYFAAWDWYIVASGNESELYGTLNHLRYALCALIAITLLGVALVLVVPVRRVAHTYTKVTRELQECRQEMAEQKQALTHARDAEWQMRQTAEALREIGQLVNSTLNLEEVLQSILTAMGRIIAYDSANVMLLNGDMLNMCAVRGYIGAEQAMRLRLRITDLCNLQRVIETGRPQMIEDTTTGSTWQPHVTAEGARIRSWIGMPLTVKDDVLGILNVASYAPRKYNETDLPLVSAFANQVALAVRNAQLYKQAQHDAETKAMLLDEVNHRVKNNLAAIIGLLYAERKHAPAEIQVAYRAIIDDMINRIRGLAVVHSMLSVSEWTPISLSLLINEVIAPTLNMLPSDKHVGVKVTSTHFRVTSRQASHIALVINELATNTLKHALKDRADLHIRVDLAMEGDEVLCEFRDDGAGYPEAVLARNDGNVGLYLVKNIVCEQLQGELDFFNDGGAVTRMKFKLQQ